MKTLEDMLAIAQAATPGPWWVVKDADDIENRGVKSSHSKYGEADIRADGYESFVSNGYSEADSEFIAQFNPAVVQALVRECMAARSVLDTIKHIEVKSGFEAGLVWPKYSPTFKQEYSLTNIYNTARNATDEVLK